jgi:cytochrome c biogenesis protein CcmG, thiol:disulfide interchange protein DsbE
VGPIDELERAPRRRSRLLRVVIVLAPAVLFVGLLWFALMRAGSQATVGETAPGFELPTLSGDTLSSDDLKGHPVVVNFWASWCLPCREEAPLLERTWRQYRDEGVIFLGVNIKDAESDAKAFVEEFDITYPIVRDLDQELTRAFGVRGLPETFFVDHEWRFVGTESGAARGQQQGTVILGAITEDKLLTNVDILVRRAAGAR